MNNNVALTGVSPGHCPAYEPEWHCRESRMFTISIEGDEAAIKGMLKYTPFSFVSSFYQLWFCSLQGHTLSRDGKYLECSATVPVEYKGKIGGFAPYMYCTCIEAIMAGREVYGYPKRPANMEWIETPQAICTRMESAGKEILLASFVPDENAYAEKDIIDQIEEMTTCRLIHKAFPSAVGGKPELDQVIYRDLARKKSKSKWGHGFVEMNHADGHWVKELGMKRILGARYTVSSYGGGKTTEKRELL